jgi:hypothetical protein
LKNVSKSEQEKLLKIAEQKILSLLDCSDVWDYAEDIIEHLDN